MKTVPSQHATIDLEATGFDRGGHILVDRALLDLASGDTLTVSGTDPSLAVHLRAWARARGHGVEGCTVVRGTAVDRRWGHAVRPPRRTPAARAAAAWGLAPRGALVEGGGPPLKGADLDEKATVWADIAPRLYLQALAGQWDPNELDWSAQPGLVDVVEDAVVQVMTYLVENEQAALLVAARMLGRVHPHYREVMQLLAVQVADEARHVEVFTRRAELTGRPLGASGAGGRASLQTLLDEPDFSLAELLLSALGEGSFLSLLSFLERYAPDPLTARICALVRSDEARHVAFGVAHLEERVRADPLLRTRMAAAIERRHAALADTSGLSDDVADALAVLAAGEWSPAAIARGWERVQALRAEMDEGRRRRLGRLGFDVEEAAALSALHTRNFM
jgi:hypothetical protein